MFKVARNPVTNRHFDLDTPPYPIRQANLVTIINRFRLRYEASRFHSNIAGTNLTQNLASFKKIAKF